MVKSGLLFSLSLLSHGTLHSNPALITHTPFSSSFFFFSHSSFPPMPALHSLPPEIVTNIVSHLDRNDCITCIGVCQQWRRAIPPCSASLWTDVAIATNADYILDHIPYFAPHLRSVTLLSNFGENRLYQALIKLQECHRIDRLSKF